MCAFRSLAFTRRFGRLGQSSHQEPGRTPVSWLRTARGRAGAKIFSGFETSLFVWGSRPIICSKFLPNN